MKNTKNNNIKNNTKLKNSNYKTFYTKDGIKVDIKVTKDALCRSGNFIFKIKNKKTLESYYHSPNREFENIIDVIDFILKNVENKHLKFKVL